MNVQELEDKLEELRKMASENEIVEFKEAKNNYDFKKLGKYFSALSNEANLCGLKDAWLIFGIEDKRHEIVGTNYRVQKAKLNSLKGEIANKTTNRFTFIEIHELIKPQGRVVLFQIPAAPKGMPVSFDGHYYGRDDEELSPLNIEEIERIRAQSITYDWSAETIADASINDLDPKAIEVARENYKNKFPDKSSEVDNWTDTQFLNKAKLTIKDKITNAAIVILGKSESEHFISPSVAKIRWILKGENGIEKDYEVIGCPMLLAVDKVFSKIRNLNYRYIKEGTLFPEEVRKYEPYVIREAINNCIAHQDYTKCGMINVIEMEDQLIFTNLGIFIPGNVEKVVQDDAPEEHYRNRFLASAMFNLKMVDTAGGGIRKIFIYQKERFFPMPDFDFSKDKVKVTITGTILDLQYARLLARNKDLSLDEIILLDKVQKKKSISQDEAKKLRSKKLIEGRKPNYYISIKTAQKTNQKASYSKNRAFEKQYYLDLILKSIKEHDNLTRKDIDDLLWQKLPDWMDTNQKKNKVSNLISELKRNKKILNKGSFTKPKWVIYNI